MSNSFIIGLQPKYDSFIYLFMAQDVSVCLLIALSVSSVTISSLFALKDAPESPLLILLPIHRIRHISLILQKRTCMVLGGFSREII